MSGDTAIVPIENIVLDNIGPYYFAECSSEVMQNQQLQIYQLITAAELVCNRATIKLL